jgi:hypothetical protein
MISSLQCIPGVVNMGKLLSNVQGSTHINRFHECPYKPIKANSRQLVFTRTILFRQINDPHIQMSCPTHTCIWAPNVWLNILVIASWVVLWILIQYQNCLLYLKESLYPWLLLHLSTAHLCSWPCPSFPRLTWNCFELTGHCPQQWTLKNLVRRYSSTFSVTKTQDPHLQSKLVRPTSCEPCFGGAELSCSTLHDMTNRQWQEVIDPLHA